MMKSKIIIGLFCFYSVLSINAAAFVSLNQPITITPSPVALNQTFSVGFSLKETQGASLTFSNISVRILKSDGTDLFELKNYSNITIPAYSTWTPSPSPTGSIYNNPAGTYKVVVKGKVGTGAYFDFTTTGSGTNNTPFTVTQPTGSISVSLSPTNAVSAGAQWNIDGSTWRNSGTLSGITTGTHTLNFKSITGWTTPTSKSVTINQNQTTSETGAYVLSVGYGALSQGITIPSQVALNQTFSVGFSLKETLGASITYSTISVKILKSDGTDLFELANYSNITIPANSTWTPPSSPTGSIYNNPAGTYKVVIRGKVGTGAYFDFTTTGLGTNNVPFTVFQPTGYGAISQGITIPSQVALNQNFTVGFSLKETLGASITYSSISVKILKSDGTDLFELIN